MSKKFNESDCIIPEIWCGADNKIPKKKGKIYYKAGNRYECMKKGFGAGTHIERNLNLPLNSLQQIKYIGETYETSFKKIGIKNTTSLISQMKLKTTDEMSKIIKRVLTKSNNVLDVKAYNSTVLYLYKNGVPSAPACQKIKY